MAAVLKREASPEFIAKVQALEDRSDQCFPHLKLLRHPWNLGTWLALAKSVHTIQGVNLNNPYSRHRHMFGINNVGAIAKHVVGWCMDSGGRSDLQLSRFRCTRQYWEELPEAFEVAQSYEQFCRIFPRWHDNVEAAELASDGAIRFTHGLNEHDRRVFAYRANMRPPADRGKPSWVPSTAGRLEALVSEIRGTVRKGHLCMRAKRLDELYAAAYQTYQDDPLPIVEMFRRYPHVDLGGYKLDDFRKFYTALIATMSTHEHLCLLWDDKPERFPFACSVLVQSSGDWARQIIGLTGLDGDITRTILADLIFGSIRKKDFRLSPFVPLNTARTQLAVAYPYVLASAAEDNVLAVCSYLRPKVFNLTTQTKEDEMRQTLRANACPGLSIAGLVRLEKKLPDIDMLFEHQEAGVLVVAEAKWLRGRQDKELRKGVQQARAIRAFLNEKGDYLVQRKKLSRRISDYRRVVYCVIARDHLIYNDPKDIPVFAFDAMVQAVQNKDIDQGLDFLMSLDWLPKEGRDFWMRRNTASVPGVEISYDGYTRQYF